MSIKVSQAFERTSAAPIDETLGLTKAQMGAVNDNVMPAYYFTICQDDGKIYLYDKSIATPDPVTGKFTVFEGGGGISDITFIAPAYDPTATYVAGDVVTYNGLRYVANVDIDPAEDPFDPAHWDVQDVQTALDAMSGSATALYNYTTNIEVGGVPVGTSIQSTDKLADIIKQMLVTTYYPTYVAPSASLSYSANTYAEVGSTLAAKAGTVTYNAGAINLQGVKQNDRGGAATMFYISTSGADTEYSDSNASSGAFSVPALTRATKGNIVITGKVDFAEGPQPLDSNGDPYETPLPAGSVQATKTIQFIQAFFYGNSSSTTVSTLAGLTKDVSAKGQKKYKYTTNNEHMVIAYDSSYGNLTSILDPNSFETISGWTKSTITYDGFSYNVYVADAATTDTNAEFTFKF